MFSYYTMMGGAELVAEYGSINVKDVFLRMIKCAIMK